MQALLLESLVAGAGALAGHEVFDSFHHLHVHNPRGSRVVATLLPFVRTFSPAVTSRCC